MSTLPHEIGHLTVAEKFELLDALWEDLEAHPSALSVEQSAELDRRVASYERDPSSVISWERVKAQLFQQ